MITWAQKACGARYLAVALVAGAIALICAPQAFAAPFVNVWVDARVGAGPFTTGPLAVEDGQIIEYRMWAQMSPVGTHNNNATPKDIIALADGIDGINSMKYNLFGTAADPIQVDFATAATLASGWSGGTGPSGGVVTVLTGSTANYLKAIRPIQAVGTYVGVSGNAPVEVLVATGSAVAHGSSLTTDSHIGMSGKVPVDQTINAGIRINTPAASVNTLTSWADPGVGYSGLILYTPWADAVIPGVDPVTGYVVDLMKNEDLHLMAAVGGSSHTNVEYKWTIMSPEIIVYGRDVIVPSALLATLPGEHHIVRLDVSGDGKTDSMEVPLALVPEPATMALLALGGLAVASVRRRRIR
jgi:hypothetical protein